MLYLWGLLNDKLGLALVLRRAFLRTQANVTMHPSTTSSAFVALYHTLGVLDCDSRRMSSQNGLQNLGIRFGVRIDGWRTQLVLKIILSCFVCQSNANAILC